MFVSSLGSFRALSQDLSIFERATGAKLNPEKTKGLRLGSWRYRDLPFGASWSDQNIKINGIWFGYDAPCDVTWNERAEVFESRLETFGTRWLSILGKSPLLIVSFRPSCGTRARCTNSASRPGAVGEGDFSFNGRWYRACQEAVLYQKLEKGGLGVVHLGILDRPFNGRPFLVGRTGGKFASWQAVLEAVKSDIRLQVEGDFRRLSRAAFFGRWCAGEGCFVSLRAGRPFVVF
ncbi:hypothetical protein BSL78_10694 [Apostichopus japonicus]|uniref:Uncharacterized protein n=1 Tax=Stichopus japonicus TaxID=307972 RepID=A0A2G8KWN8_STIJA|nr:hypothetical protein BSL78_10694 [Apostichopus japonicus]